VIDRNKSELTHDVTHATATWLEERGFKPVETEVPMPWAVREDKPETGWIADLAAVLCPTQTELINLKLLRRAPPWIRYDEGFNELPPNTNYAAWSAERESLIRIMTCLVEVKTTRSDFCGDRKWTAALPTDLAYLAVPRGLITPEEWPAGWGILEHSDNGIRQRRPPTPGITTTEQQRDVILSIAVRRDHHTRYARWRELQKEQRIRQSEDKTISRLGSLTRAVLAITQGKHETVKNCLDYHGLRKMPKWAMEPLEKLWSIASQENSIDSGQDN
jgi:hypothetical protein